jgi:hypothetical protein
VAARNGVIELVSLPAVAVCEREVQRALRRDDEQDRSDREPRRAKIL